MIVAKYLVIVESPAKSKTIKKFLGSSYKVEASMGHVRDLPKSKLGIDLDNDFEPQYINIRGKGDLIKKLRNAAKTADKIYLATDPDREGEAISWHLLSALKLEDKKVFRIEFHEITESAVKDAIKSARDINMDLVDAQQARRLLDRLVGYQISPILWRKIAKGLSAGRVQSVALRLICDREELIEKFVPEEYWTVDANFGFDGDIFSAKLFSKNGEKILIKDKNEVKQTLSELKKQEFKVTLLKHGEKNRNPYMPFKTSTLQQVAFSKLGFATRKTMQIAQQLYEGINIEGRGYVGLITYMRTDSTRLSNEFKNSCAEFIKQKYGEEYLGDFDRKEKNNSTVIIQDAHEGIRVTDAQILPIEIKSYLTSDQYKLYKLIWERSVAALMAKAAYETTSLEITAGQYTFKANGSNLKFDGFMKCYETTKDENEDMIIPKNITEGKVVELDKLFEKQHFTEAPSRFTEASLVKELEENGIGRPSTYATIITTIIDRRYIEREEKKLMPTELGMIVNDLMKKYFKDIVSVTFTADIEKQLDLVAKGTHMWKETMRDFYTSFKPLVDEAELKIEKVELKVEESDVVCEKCGRRMVIKQGRFGKFLACPGFPDCRNAKPFIIKTGTHCPKCHGEVLQKKSKKGRTFYTCENAPDSCDFISWDKILDERCEHCGKQLYETGMKNKKIVCRNENCEVGVPVKSKGNDKIKKSNNQKKSKSKSK